MISQYIEEWFSPFSSCNYSFMPVKVFTFFDFCIYIVEATARFVRSLHDGIKNTL